MGEPTAKPELLSLSVLTRIGPPIAVLVRNLAPAKLTATPHHALEEVLVAFRRTPDA